MGAGILVVAGEAKLRGSLARVCHQVDHHVRLAETPAQALVELSQEPITLCLLGLDSAQSPSEILAFLQQARRRNPLLELIVLSDDDTWLPQASRSELALYAVLPKPWPEDRILASVIQGAIRYHDLRCRYEALHHLWHESLEQLEKCGQTLRSLSEVRDMLATLVRSLVDIPQIETAGAIYSQGANPGDPPCVVLGSHTELSAARASALARLLATAGGQVGASLEPEIVRLPPQSLSVTVEMPGHEAEPMSYGTEALSLPDGSWVALAITSWQKDADEGTLRPLLSSFGALAQGAFEQRAVLTTAWDLASRDGLTGLYDYAHFMRLLARAIEHATDTGQHLVVMMLDLDSAHGLKAINDRFGHQAGDHLLTGIANVLRDSVRPGDILARYGGDEFLILAPHTEPAEGLALAERLVRIVGETEFAIEPHAPAHVTLSVGVAVISEAGETPADVIAKADRGLYLAKAKGGSCIGVID
ncbi:MAG: diguanylate cyclase [Anaerolineae bacterium]|nr:diguanylate cyclase [Anaerolineae bacterium]